jgi:YbbR domain-containing protein
VRRALDFIVRNWPLKLAAILLATVLYSGLVFGQNVRTFNGTIPVDPIRPPEGATLLADLDPVTQVRYRAPLDVGVVSPASFRATVDLSQLAVQVGGASQTVPVSVLALDGRIVIVDFQPRDIQVQLDPVAEKQMPVTVTVGTVPDGVSLGPPQTDPSNVTIRGASSRVNFVTAVVARVAIDASALNVDRDFELVPVDSNGNQVPNVEVDPQRARVRIAVARELANRTLPVVPTITGQPEAGYRISSVTVDPATATLSGEASAIAQMQTAVTEPIDIAGRTTDIEAMVRVAPPTGVSVSGEDTIRVVVTIVEETGSRTFFAPVVLVDTQASFNYELDTNQVQVIATGPLSIVDGIDPSAITATISVAGLAAGPHTLQFSLPEIADVTFESSVRGIVVTASDSAPSPTPALQ